MSNGKELVPVEKEDLVRVEVVEYSSNNSGGGWWLKDQDWRALEAAGWHVEWGGNWYCSNGRMFSSHPNQTPEKPPETRCPEGKCKGHRMYESADAVVQADNRYLGDLASHATRTGLSLADAIAEFERTTHQDTSDEGCNCCGPPHSFSSKEGYVSGEGVLDVIFQKMAGIAGLSKRQILEKIAAAMKKAAGEDPAPTVIKAEVVPAPKKTRRRKKA
jgi:hypothetical protein